MSKKPALTGKTLSYVTIEPSGSVTVDIEKFLRSDIGKARLVDLKNVGQKMRTGTSLVPRRLRTASD
jgi:hypothetical protein